MAFSPSNSLRQQTQLYSVTLCKCQWTLNPFNFHFPSSFFTFSPPKHPPQPSFSPLLVVRARVTDQEISNNTMNHATNEQSVSGLPYFRANYKRVGNKYVKKIVRKDGDTGQRVDSRKRREMDSGFSSVRSKDENLVKKSIETDGNSSSAINRKKGNKDIKGCDKQLGVEEKMRKGTKKSKVDSSGVKFRVGLDMCSKRGDVMGALKLYDSARREGITMGQYHYTVLLYLCSSAATGIVHPAKSGTHGRSLSIVATRPTTSEVSTVNDEVSEISGGIEVDSSGFTTEVGKDNLDITFNGEKLAQDNNGVAKPSPQVIDGKVDLGSEDSDFRNNKDSIKPETYEIRVSEDLMKYALRRGFEIYERMCLEKVPMNEASLTSVARMALAMGDGDMAFDTVKQMKVLGINPRLRSYGPALSAFCSCGDIDKAFAVEEHMLEHGVYPEEPELEALLRVSIEVGRSDKVYYVLHKLRTSVRKVLPSTADLIEKWFKSKVASKVGKRKLDQSLIREAIENGGGGWHGQGWLGKGKWNVSRTFVGADGLCKCCGEKLATIDLDPKETERFAESVASIATQKEKTSFQKFRKWLDCYGPFEAVVDGANIGLFKERMFRPSKVNAVVNEIRKLLPSRKWPLIVVHNRRITGSNMAKPVNKALIEEWKAADALYATPTGSNDDWYWLYAAIKFKCLIVTNDEMRDHLFQLLGNDFFPRWKERHQVRFNFSDTGLLIHMPPPYSVVIQESERGYWHIPIVSEHDDEGQRTWLCIKRANSPGAKQVTPTMHEESLFPLHKKVRASSDTPTKTEAKLTPLNQGKHINTRTLNSHLKKVTGI